MMYKVEGLIAPLVVEQHIQKYKEDSGYPAAYIQASPGGFIKWTDLYEHFVSWYKENINVFPPTKPEVKQYFEKRVFGQEEIRTTIEKTTQRGWKGFILSE